jgi:hypothetical protein
MEVEALVDRTLLASLLAKSHSQCTLQNFRLTIMDVGPAITMSCVDASSPLSINCTSGDQSLPRLTNLQALEGHTDRVWAVAWSPSGMRRIIPLALRVPVASYSTVTPGGRASFRNYFLRIGTSLPD